MITFNKSDWKMSTCTCQPFQKKYLCKHVVGLAVKNNLYSLRPEAKTVPLGERRGPGRPKKAKKALLAM
jgi:uncharacterized Zn finger protein